jgi:parallel beta-helix repeat protein
VDLAGSTLSGSPPTVPSESYGGTGIVVEAKRVTLRNGAVRGFRCGILARNADGSTFEDLDLSDNAAARLASTREAEDPSDWLWPHENDGREWVTRYGAGLCVERSSEVSIRRITVRRTQNGILLDRVERSRIYDNDCSFLSGWGLAMWRSNGNVVCRNAFDFCVRGYSHGVYSRGQDSAGILLFEQCSDNTIALNSATHGGDGLFGFAGKEALGERPAPEGAEPTFHRGRGSNRNVIIGNDFSFAAAHGLEMTFSFGNVIAHNRFEGNGICGIWGGYSAETIVARNTFSANGGGKDPGEGGGIDFEHGRGNRIEDNAFDGEGTAVECWWDEDPGLAATPWAKANGVTSEGNMVIANRFSGGGTAVALIRSAGDIVIGNQLKDMARGLFLDRSNFTIAPEAQFAGATLPVESIESTRSEALPKIAGLPAIPSVDELRRTLPGLHTPVGQRRSMGGREAIRMTAYGPWDGRKPVLFLEKAAPHQNDWRKFGSAPLKGAEVFGGGSLRVAPDFPKGFVRVLGEMPGVMPYLLRVRYEGGQEFALGCIVVADWKVVFFPSPADPRQHYAEWRAGADSPQSVAIEAPAIDFVFGNDGPTFLRPSAEAAETLRSAELPADGFGTVASTTVYFPKGEYLLRVISDDGIRVKIGGKLVLDDWTWHPPRESRVPFTIDESGERTIEVEHFELDGFAVLRLFIDGELDAERKAAAGVR